LLSSHQDFKFDELTIDKTYLVQNQTIIELRMDNQ
jgi:hypothetical protein